MSLLNLTTNLKSLKYGSDRPGGGDSGQPYIQSDINSAKQIVRKDEDGYIRGGNTGAKNASTTDLLRIERFIDSKPKGYLFITKQIGLQYSNPRLETKKVKIGGESGIIKFVNSAINTVSSNLGPTRIYNLGLNTLAQVPQTAYGIYFNRHGLTPIQDDETKYQSVVKSNNENGSNRLSTLIDKFKLGVNSEDLPINTSSQQLISSITNKLQQAGSIVGGLIGGKTSIEINNVLSKVSKAVSLFNNNEELIIDDYIGGPGSTYGIGKTIIRRYDNTEDNYRISSLIDKSKTTANAKRILWGKLYTDINVKNQPSSLALIYNPNSPQKTYDPIVEKQNSIKALSVHPSLKKYSDLKTAIDKQILNGSDFSSARNITHIGSNRDNTNSPINYYNISPISKAYKTGTLNSDLEIESTNQTKSPSKKVAFNYGAASYASGRMVDSGSGYNTVKDYVDNLKDKSKRPLKSDYKENKGLQRDATDFKYYGDAQPSINNTKNSYYNTPLFERKDEKILSNVFTIINPFTSVENKVVLSSYMKGFKEDFTGTWNDVNYAGRAESFYIYNKFKRNVSFNLQIPCFNRNELFAKHRLLGQLASTTAGAYNDSGFLGGVLIKLNIGNYIVGEYSILNSLNYSIPDDASWDTTTFRGLSMLIEASFNFTIIHKKLPQYNSNGGFFSHLTEKPTQDRPAPVPPQRLVAPEPSIEDMLNDTPPSLQEPFQNQLLPINNTQVRISTPPIIPNPIFNTIDRLVGPTP